MNSITDLYNITRQLSSCLIFLFVACTSKSPSADAQQATSKGLALSQQKMARAFVQIDSIKKIITTGDLILRTGNDFTSESLRSLCRRDQTYSHCGIASIENDSVFVYHALGGEWNPDEKIRRDPIEVFAEPYSNRGIGVYRFGLHNPEIDGVMETVLKMYDVGVMFDMKFDLKTDDKMYCAEFVYRSYSMGSKGRLQFNISHINNFEFIGVDDLFLQPDCLKQASLVYK